MSKQPRSFSIDEEVAEALTRREDVNASGAVNSFLKKYLASDRGREAALEVRLSQLDEQIADKRKELDRLERERERVEEDLDSQRAELHDALDRFEEEIERGSSFDLTPDNPVIQKFAAEAGVSPQDFIDELETR